MAEWMDLGEVPDSEDEDELFHEPFSAFLSTEIDGKSLDAWTIPSPNDNDLNCTASGSLAADKFTARESSDSSPLSSVPSDIELPPLKTLLLFKPENLQAEARYQLQRGLHGQFDSSLSNKLESTPTSAEVETPRTSRILTKSDVQLLNSVNQNADLLAVRVGRSLRPRKPIQEHPYLLENAKYSTILKSHGVRPLRMESEAGSQRRYQQQPPDRSTDDEDQGLAENNSSQNSNRDGSSTSYSRPWEKSELSASSPFRSSARSTSQDASSLSQAEHTEDSSQADQDVSAVDETLKQHLPLSTRELKKRFPTASDSERSIAHPEAPELAVKAISALHTPQTSGRLIVAIDSARRFAARSGSDNASTSSPSISFSAPLSPELEESPTIAGQDYKLHHLKNASVPAAGSYESDAEVVQSISRRIKGVLPASWLRLDQESDRRKIQENVKRQRIYRQTVPKQQRGVAQVRQIPNTVVAQVFLDLSDEDNESRKFPPLRTKSEESGSRASSVPLVYSQLEDISDEIAIDDFNSVSEDNRIDKMLPTEQRSKRRTQPSGSHQPARKRLRRAKEALKRPKDSRLTARRHFPPSQRTQRAKRPHGGYDLATWAYNESGAGRFGTLHNGKRGSTDPPQLGILDVIEIGAPSFLKIAARTASKRRRLGRSSLQQKNIQLASRHDHVEVANVLHNWKSGAIAQRSSISFTPRVRQLQRPLESIFSNNVPDLPSPRQGLSASAHQFVRTVSDSGATLYQTNNIRRMPHNLLVHSNHKVPQNGPLHFRPAQFETQDHDVCHNTFQLRKRHLDRWYRDLPMPMRISTIAPPIKDIELTTLKAVPKAPIAETSGPAIRSLKSLRKEKKPESVNTKSPVYTRALDPLPSQNLTEPRITSSVGRTCKLKGLGPYGTQYTHHFEIFPLGSGVFFHESTLIGSGLLNARVKRNGCPITAHQPRTSFTLGSHVLSWGTWNLQMSSEMGILFDFIAEQFNTDQLDKDNEVQLKTAIDAAEFILKHLTQSKCFFDKSAVASFVTRVLGCLRSFNECTGITFHQLIQKVPFARDNCLGLYDRFLLIGLALLELCQSHSLLIDEMFHVLRAITENSLSMLLSIGVKPLRETYGHLNCKNFRERGLRGDSQVMHSWVMAMKVLEIAQIPRASFWAIAQVKIASPEMLSLGDARLLEVCWEMLFVILPLFEFHDTGILLPGTRHRVESDGWPIVQGLLKSVFESYKSGVHQSPSFNNYCRALIGRCCFLVQHWGWWRSASAIGVIFDFFGSQELTHLRNEEALESPRFLRQLQEEPSLDVEAGEVCFHIFLKFVSLSARKLREGGLINDLRNMIARITPNHNRQFSKDQKINARDLAALRNHHDLLCTLFWVSPPPFRPAVLLIERLVEPAESHREACLINIRTWKNMARFIVASGETASAFRTFASWRDNFFKSVLGQFDSVAADVQQQLLAMGSDVRNTISDEVIHSTVSMNRAAVLDVLYASVAASLEVACCAPDLEAAILSLNLYQLQEVFQRFAQNASGMDWGILRAAVLTLKELVRKIEVFNVCEDSQQTESQVLAHAQADEAVLLLSEEISPTFFLLARYVLQGYGYITSANEELARSDFLEIIVSVSASICKLLIGAHLISLSDSFRAGKHGLFDKGVSQMCPNQRKWLILYVSMLLESGVNDFSGAGFHPSQLWVLSLVGPRHYSTFESQLGRQLLRKGCPLVPQAVSEWSGQADYDRARELFSYAVSEMRSSVRSVGRSPRKELVQEHSTTLKLGMEQIKRDLKAVVCSNELDRRSYESFVHDIISLIKMHGAGICAVDDFFYQSSGEYTPSVKDPQLQMAGLVSYGLRLETGDGSIERQLFFLLFNNAKVALNNDKLAEEARMWQEGMSQGGTVSFILGKILPAILKACRQDHHAFPLMDILSEALRLCFAKQVVGFEWRESSLHHLVTLLESALLAIAHASGSETSPSEAWMHVLGQTVCVLNMLWPSIYALSATAMQTSLWERIICLLKSIKEEGSTLEQTLSELAEQRDYKWRASSSSAAMLSQASVSSLDTDHDVCLFASTIIQDISRNWRILDGRLTISGSRHGGLNSEARAGVELPGWEMRTVFESLRERLREWCWWWQKVFGVRTDKTALLENIVI